nr:serine/threonine protein kinase [Deltaproteobacteria bacterium]
METQPVEKFGKYNLLRKIGQGGMAEVFLATMDGAPQSAPPLVVKRLHQELERNRDAVDLFLTEADVTLMLSHPNVIRVYDSGEINNRYYMAMEYVHGKDLEQIAERFLAKNKVMDPYAASYIAISVFSGLDYVHRAKTPSGRELGIVHRDVTPSNVYVRSDGHVKLGDFGVAKLVAVEGWTMAGSVKGKLGYLSPEQVGGQPPSQQIDLWAAAVILWELCTGQRLFVGDNELDVMLRIRKAKVPSVRKVNKAVPKDLERILDKALHRKPHKRYLEAASILKDLEKFQAARPMTPELLVKYITETLS